jgi:hypothetical protein
VLSVLEAFAVECSINKVWTSEALAWVTDEAVQVFGGNGYSCAFPVERAYRDARITRIYEGTNEINRLLIPTRLLKQSGDGFQRAARQPSGCPAMACEDGLDAEWAALACAKDLAVAVLANLASAYPDSLKAQQEILGHAADLVIEVYAMESALARASKQVRMRGAEGAGVAVDLAQIYVSEAIDRIRPRVRETEVALEARRSSSSLARLATSLDGYRRVDAIAVRRRVADAVVAAGGALP